MSGKLFKNGSHPTAPIKARLAIEVQAALIDKIKNAFPGNDCFGLGSTGHKRLDDYNNDLDIGVQAKDVDELYEMIHKVFSDNETVVSKTFYIVSMKQPYLDDDETKYVSVDFILVNNPEYTRFRYYCPNYANDESRYKVGTKIMFVGNILNHCIDHYNEDRTINYKLLFTPVGLDLEACDLINHTYVDERITDDWHDIANMLFDDGCFDDFMTVETLWAAIHSDRFKYKDRLKEIEMSFFLESYFKEWEEQVMPEDFELTYWTAAQIREAYRPYKKMRHINSLLDKAYDYKMK